MTSGTRKHATLLAPYVACGLGSLLLGASIGLVQLLRIHLGWGELDPLWSRLHGQLQTFGFLVPLVAGFATYVGPRILAGEPLRSPRLARLGALLLAAGAVAAAAALADPWPPLLRAMGVLSGAGAVCAALALLEPFVARIRAGLRAYELVVGAALAACALAGACDALAWGGPGLREGALLAADRLAIEGFGVGLSLAVSMRTFPGFLGIDPARAWPGGGSPRVPPRRDPMFHAAALAWAVSVAFGAAAELAGSWRGVAVADALFAAGVGPLALRLGLASTRGGPRIDRERDRLFPLGARASYAMLGLAALAGLGAASSGLAGLPVHAFWTDARRHLITVGFLLTLIALMSGRLAPGYAGRPLALPALRAFALVAFPLAALLRATEAVAGQWGPASLLRASAASGPLAVAGVVALVASVGTTLTRAARA